MDHNSLTTAQSYNLSIRHLKTTGSTSQGKLSFECLTKDHLSTQLGTLTDN